MSLFNKGDSKENCMLAYDSLSGYVEKSPSSDIFSQELECCVGNLSLGNCRNLLYKELLSFINAHFVKLECYRSKPITFQECYPENLTQHCQKIGEGLYGEVFLYRNRNGGTTVMKVIPLEGSQTVNGEYQKKFKEVFAEIVIAVELSNLRDNSVNRTSAFIEVQNIQFVRGRYPEELLDLWQLYKETRGSINDSPEIFDDDQLYAVLETNYGGCDLESFIFDNAAQTFSMFMQVAFALAVAERELQFEHRDLHWGNILITRIPVDEKVTFVLGGREIKIESHGIKATIIDFTMSRITTNGLNIYTDLGKDCGIFNGSGDYQFEIYQLMQKKNGNEWSHNEPYSNILWLSYLLDKTITALHYEDTCSKMHKKYMNKLKELNLEVVGYDNTNDFVLDLYGNKVL